MWGMYWRYILSISLSLLLVSFLSEQLNLINLVNHSNLQPTVFLSIIAVLFIAVTYFQRKGISYLFFGNRLRLSDKAWYWFNFITVSLFVVLAVFGFVVSQIVTKEALAIYKLFGQPLCLVLFPLFSSWFIVRREKHNNKT